MVKNFLSLCAKPNFFSSEFFLVTAFYCVHFNRYFSSKVNVIAGSFNFAKRQFFATCFIRHKVMHIMYLSMSCPTYHTPGICGARVGIDLTILVVVFPTPWAAGVMSQILVEFCTIQATRVVY